MRLLILCFVTSLIGTLDVLALNDNRLERWKSPDGKFVVAEKFYGEGKRVNGVFINRRTVAKDLIYPDRASGLDGARSLEVKWSTNSRYFALDADRSKSYGEALVFYVTSSGRPRRVALPKKLTTAGLEDLVPANKRDKIGAWFGRANLAEKWLTRNRLKMVVGGNVHLLGDEDSTDFERRYLVGFRRGKVAFVRLLPSAK